MSLRAPALLSVPALLLVATGCGDDSSGSDGTVGGDAHVREPGLVAEGATLAWTAQLEADWSPTDAVAAGGVTVVSTSWEIDEGSAVVAYAEDGSVAWEFSEVYGGVLLAVVGGDEVLACDDDTAVTLSADDGSVVDEGTADDERCPVADDEDGVPVDHHDEAYTVTGSELAVDGPDGAYAIELTTPADEIWGVDSGVVTFEDDTDRVSLYR